MKFLLELVPCCGSPRRRSGTTPLPSLAEDEMRYLVQPPRRLRRRRRRGRLGPSGSVVAAEWRPSLCAISEDNVVAEKVDEREVGSERKVKRKAPSHVRSHSDELRRSYSSESFIPAFSATPFMF